MVLAEVVNAFGSLITVEKELVVLKLPSHLWDIAARNNLGGIC